MKNNQDIQKDVQEALKWEPLLNAAETGVTVKDGVVTLTGVVDSYAKNMEAEDAAKSVSGVKAVVEKIKIEFGSTGKTSDGELAREILNAFKWNWEVPDDKIKIKVEEGWVTLKGDLQWNYQREAARKSVNRLFGVKGVINDIKIKSETRDAVEKKDIENALVRNWSMDNQDIRVNVSGNRVTLNDTVDSLYQKGEAERIAWNAPGV